MKKARASQLIARAWAAGHAAGRVEGEEAQRRRQTEYLQAKPGTLDMAPPPSVLYREIAVQPRWGDCRAYVPKLRLRAVANVLQLQPDPRGEPMLVRFFTWEPWG